MLGPEAGASGPDQISERAELNLLPAGWGIRAQGQSPVSQMGRPKPALWMALCWGLGIQRQGRKTLLSGTCGIGVLPFPLSL